MTGRTAVGLPRHAHVVCRLLLALLADLWGRARVSQAAHGHVAQVVEASGPRRTATVSSLARSGPAATPVVSHGATAGTQRETRTHLGAHLPQGILLARDGALDLLGLLCLLALREPGQVLPARRASTRRSAHAPGGSGTRASLDELAGLGIKDDLLDALDLCRAAVRVEAVVAGFALALGLARGRHGRGGEVGGS